MRVKYSAKECLLRGCKGRDFASYNKVGRGELFSVPAAVEPLYNVWPVFNNDVNDVKKQEGSNKPQCVPPEFAVERNVFHDSCKFYLVLQCYLMFRHVCG